MAMGRAKEHAVGAKTANWGKQRGSAVLSSASVTLGEPALPPSLLMQLLFSWGV